MTFDYKAAKDAAWEKRLRDPGPDSWGLQYFTEWSDYPDWEDAYDWDGDDEPIRFATKEDALAFLDAQEEYRYHREHTRWLERKAVCDKKQELHQRRKQCLIENGLWTTDSESMSPLLYPAGPGREPTRGWERRWRVVHDSKMDEPIEVWKQETLR